MDCSTPGFPALHQLLEFTQTHIHWVDDAIQPSHPLSSPSLPAFSLSQHQGFFQWVCSTRQVTNIGASASASVFPMNSQDWFPLGLTGLISLQSKGLSRVSNSLLQHYPSKASVLHIRWPECWSFSFIISPFNEYSGLISFRMDWLDLLAVQGTLKSLLQHHGSKASILRFLAFFIA